MMNPQGLIKHDVILICCSFYGVKPLMTVFLITLSNGSLKNSIILIN